jgi:hypothetical protein
MHGGGIGQGHFIELGHVIGDCTAMKAHYDLTFLKV